MFPCLTGFEPATSPLQADNPDQAAHFMDTVPLSLWLCQAIAIALITGLYPSLTPSLAISDELAYLSGIAGLDQPPASCNALISVLPRMADSTQA